MTQIILKITRVVRDITIGVDSKSIYLEGGKPLSSLLSTIGWKLIILIQESNKKATNRIRLLHKFHLYLRQITKDNGVEFTVKYLKACSLALSKVLAGSPLRSLRELEPDLPLPRLKSCGLPKIIGTRDIKSLRSGSYKVARLWLTIFSIYRVIYIPGKAKLNTITDPFSGNPTYLGIVENWMEHKAPTLLRRFTDDMEFHHQKVFTWDERASASNKKSWLGMLTDLSLLKCSELAPPFLYFVRTTLADDMTRLVLQLWQFIPDVQSEQFTKLPMKDSLRSLYDPQKYPMLGLGQLFQKEEAAGKIRTFAIVDSWTQTVLKPLHTFLSDLLRKIPNDGTASHLDAFDRVRVRSKEFGCSYGYDLSAATDRLPLSLQIRLLTGLFGKTFAENWAKLLVGRPYYLFKKNKEPISYNYAVGQPMGARSSFTMLGLTHHMLVQFASSRLGNHWENRYEIVGDDIVIFDRSLALSYLEVMKLIGVPINLSKSVVAENRPVAEYVKRVTLNGVDISPYSWKQFMSQSSTYLGRMGTFIGLLLKDKYLSKRAISVFHLIMKRHRWDKTVETDYKSLLQLYLVYASKCKLSMEAMVRVFLSLNPYINDGELEFGKFQVHQLGNYIKQLINGEIPPSDSITTHYNLVLTKLLNYYKSLNKKLIKVWDFKTMKSNEYKIRDFVLGDLDYNDLDEECQEVLSEYMWLNNPAQISHSGEGPFLSEYTSPCEWPGLLPDLERYRNLYDDSLNKISWLNIHNREILPESDQAVDTRDTRELRILTNVLTQVLSESNGK